MLTRFSIFLISFCVVSIAACCHGGYILLQWSSHDISNVPQIDYKLRKSSKYFLYTAAACDLRQHKSFKFLFKSMKSQNFENISFHLQSFLQFSLMRSHTAIIKSSGALQTHRRRYFVHIYFFFARYRLRWCVWMYWSTSVSLSGGGWLSARLFSAVL